MPLTLSGQSVMRDLKKEYGEKKGEQIFYAMINKGAKGSEKWHKAKMREHMLRGKK